MSNAWEACKHCGASLRLHSIFDRNLSGLARYWKIKHERVCVWRTPRERMKWARRFLKRGYDTSITIDEQHPGMRM